ncbi:rod shape-determining protein [Thermanaerovibrio acidaminovorans]|uniref:rod shape-determining protein n=1 Tax=Thermanaerovibrio acidaminovorans TaxID=81462 RepID=UPI002490AA80|nr:rod shape-determining protein [Thermanaerovibrio acidaminovorans]
MWGKDIGIDLGTATVIIFIKDKGVVLREPSVVAMDQNNGRILAVGEDAKQMLGRTPGNVVAVRPLRDGVIADYTMTEVMLRQFIKKVTSGFERLVRHRVMICVPSGATDVERRAVLEAAIEVGAKEAYLIEEPMAAAIGAGLDIAEPRGNMVVDIGGGTTDIAVISLGGIVVSESLRVGGDKFDEGISRYVRKQFNLAIGEQTAEDLKVSIGTCYPQGEDMTMDVRGRDLIQGLPRQVKITSSDVAKAIEESVGAIVGGIRRVLELTPPELAADIIERGIILTGGGALLRGLPQLVTEQTEINTIVADHPLECVALGTGKALMELDKLKESGTVLSAFRRGRHR